MIVLHHTINKIRFKERIEMRTTNSLAKAVVYQNNTPVYNGDIERVYTSAVFVSLQVHLVRAPQGAKIENAANDELKQTIKRLKPGQIGALKEAVSEQILGSEPFLEMLTPCDRSNTIAVAEVCRDLAKPSNITEGMVCTVNGVSLAIDTVKDTLIAHRDENREIQSRWIEFVRTERAKVLSSADKLRQKERIYSSYVSVTEYTLVVSGEIRHIVNNPALNSTVVRNADTAYYNDVNYTNGNARVRKTAQERLPIVSIPIATKGDYNKSLSLLRGLITKSDIVKKLKTIGGEEVYHEGGLFGNDQIDWENLRGLDSVARQNQVTV